MQGKGN